MKKRILSMVMIVCMLYAFVPVAHASTVIDSGTCGENLTWTIDDEGTLTISGTGDMEDYYFDRPWDNHKNNIESVIINSGVTTIGWYAFSEYRSLTSVIIPNSVISIGYNAFARCSSLADINIPDGVTSIGWNAFAGCSSLISISIPDSVTSIGDNAFRECTSLTSISIPDSVISIGAGAFSDTAYYNDTANWSDKVLYIDNHLIETDSSISGEYIIKNNTVSVAAWAFSGCASLTSISIPNSVTSIGDGAFSGCTSLTSISIPDSVTSIGVNAFENTAYYNNSANWSDKVLYIDNHLIQAQSDVSGEYKIRNKTVSIGDAAFYRCTLLTNISIPESVVSIGYDAFRVCTSLTSISIPGGVTSIGSGTFCDCSSLVSISMPNSITYIGGRAFDSCTSLTSISIPDSVTSIGRSMFFGCSSLTSINIPVSVISIDEWAFADCNLLKDVYYSGTEEKWNLIDISENDNDALANAIIHYNTASIPIPSVTFAEVTSANSGYIFDIDVTDIPYACELLTVVYDNGRLTGFASAPVTSDDTKKTVFVPTNSADSAKVFIWDGLGEVKPLCGVFATDIE